MPPDLRNHLEPTGGDAALVTVRNGYLPERFIQTGIGPVSVRQPRVRDRGDGAIRFTSAILPRYLRRAKSLEDLLPWLYLKGISTGDFGEPASRAASSLERPVAIAAQNRTSSSRRAESGRPGECNLLRPDRSDRRLRTVIVTSYARVLRRPIELAQYCSDAYQARLGELGFLASMSGKGNCYDNAVVETFFKTIKSELIWRTVFMSRSQAETAIAGYIDGFYNPVRRHSTLDFTSPVKFEAEAMQTV